MPILYGPIGQCRCHWHSHRSGSTYRSTWTTWPYPKGFVNFIGCRSTHESSANSVHWYAPNISAVFHHTPAGLRSSSTTDYTVFHEKYIRFIFSSFLTKMLINLTIFTVRRYALHGLSHRNSVCLSVTLVHCTVSTWFDLRSWFRHNMVAPSF